MPSLVHQDALAEAIKEYADKGYLLHSLGTTLIPRYRPDVVLTKRKSMVIVEVVCSSEHIQSIKEIETHFPSMEISLDVRRIDVRRLFGRVTVSLKPWLLEELRQEALALNLSLSRHIENILLRREK